MRLMPDLAGIAHLRPRLPVLATLRVALPKVPLSPTAEARGWASELLNPLRILEEGWDGEDSPVPNADAFRHAEEILVEARLRGYEPLEIDADVLGGIALYFSAPAGHAEGEAERWAWIACMNTGGRTVTLRARGAEHAVTRQYHAGMFDHVAGFLQGRTGPR